jgi:CUB domain
MNPIRIGSKGKNKSVTVESVLLLLFLTVAAQFEMVDANRRYNTPCAFDFFSNRNAKSGSFFSPLYPQNYPAHSHCIYAFHGLPDELVRVTFRQILLGNGDRRGFVNT